jgi:hypothetical protein
LGRRSRRARKPSAARPASPPPAAPPVTPPDRYAVARAKNDEVRAALEPLAEGERPRAVTIAAAVAFVMAVANVVAALAGNSLGSNAAAFTVMSTVLLLACAGGMWAGARHWAVLGFMMILIFQILELSAALVRVRHWWGALIVVVAIGLLSWLFWILIRALSRIQMPERRPSR